MIYHDEYSKCYVVEEGEATKDIKYQYIRKNKKTTGVKTLKTTLY